MTTTDAVTAWRIIDRSQRARLASLLCAAAIVTSLSACGSSNLLGGSGDSSPSVASAPLPTAAQPAPVSQAKVALAPIVGVPDAVNKQISGQIGPSLERQRIVLAKAGEKPDYTLRGYMVAAKEKAGVKVSYIWDLTDPSGKRANRIQGEEVATGGDGRDPWSAVTPQVTQTISDKMASSLATALSSLTPMASNASAPVGVGAPPPTTTASIPAAAPAPAAAPTPSPSAAAVPAAPPGVAMAIVPAVTGAPGDGNASLTSAMRQELQQAGLGVGQAGQRGYSVAGKVTVGPAKDGKQPIKIDWRVTDPNGVMLATVSQNNEIAAGSLDGAWGNIANDAAQGAAVKIKTLIDENQSSAAAGAAPRTKAASRSKS